MYERAFSRGKPAILLATLAGAIISGHAGPAVGFTPESPEVKQAIARGVQFVRSHGGGESRLGGMALVGMVMSKTEGGRADPSVGRAVTAIQAALASGDVSKIKIDNTIYSTGLAAIFLLQLDPKKYQAEIELLMQYLRSLQMPNGGWGYPGYKTGDTSMIQYAVLSSWEASQAGFNVPIESIERMAVWLLKTQDPSGGFGYQGRVSPSFVPINQSEVALGVSAAGLGSVYICADLLGLAPRVAEPGDDLPPALKRIDKKGPQQAAGAKTRLDPRLFQTVLGRGVNWFKQNYRIDPPRHPHYYMYALERCMSFRELSEKGPKGKKKDADGPPWYNDGVRHLLATQAEDGSWESGCGHVVDTSFAILFLMRSTRKSIAKARGFGDGTMIGGRGLPKDTEAARVGASGKVMPRAMMGPAEQLLAVLENTEIPDYQQVIDLLAELPPEHGEMVMKKHANKLRQLAGNSSATARIAAVRAMAKTRDLDNVPTLIYALTDPDPEIVADARDALRRIARRPGGFGLVDRPDESQCREAIKKWKAWYLAVRPDAEFADD